MCCRFYILPHDEELAPILEAASSSPLLPRVLRLHPAPLVREGEVFPTDLVAAVASDRRRRSAVFPMVWGFSLPGKATPLVNARVETAGRKPIFRQSWEQHRCAIPASWYFEWQQQPSADGRKAVKVKYAIQPREEHTAWLCGLYRIEQGIPVFVVLTRSPSPSVAQIHDRMPLLLPKQAIGDWIDPAVRPEDLLPYALCEMSAEKA